MIYDFLDNSIDVDNMILPNSDKINPFLLKNNNAEIIKGIDFLSSQDKFLHVHGFMGTGKRQYINYLCEFLSPDVIKLEYYCKEATVCDDILLSFLNILENHLTNNSTNLKVKITTLKVKLLQQILTIKKPFLIVLHSFDDVQEENAKLIRTLINDLICEPNIKIIISTRALKPTVFGELDEDKKIFLKAFSQDIFKEFLTSQKITAGEQTIADFYKYTRGYYYYTALSIKIVQAMNIDLSEFLNKYNQSGLSFDAYLGITYVNLVPTAVRNFFWLLRTIRHGVSINILAIFDLYDEFSVQYLKENLMIFQDNDILYVQDFFLQKIDISIPQKVEVKMHKYIINIYEKQLKSSLGESVMNISRQALRAEIEFHSKCIADIGNTSTEVQQVTKKETVTPKQVVETTQAEISLENQIKSAKELMNAKKYTEAIEAFISITEKDNINLSTLIEARLNLATLYKIVGDYARSIHYYELAETYYKQHNESINLNYLYYDMTDLYFKMYKNDRAVEVIKKVIYSSDTPQSLLVSSCTLLGNIYSDMNNVDEAYTYYKKAIESLDENVEPNILAELYFKYALANDDRNNFECAMDYYNKCISIYNHNDYKALAYSNMAACYYDNLNYDDAKTCYKKAYDIEKANNNYDGIYYNASNIAKILVKEDNPDAINFLIEAQKSAEFINEEFYILESGIALGDYYYNNPSTYKDALKEYFSAYNLAMRMSEEIDISKINKRIEDMKLRMKPEEFQEVQKKYAK